MSIEYVLGVLCGILCGGLFFLFLKKWTKKDSSSKHRYDERQNFVRSHGFKYAFFTLVICDALYAAINALWKNNIIDVPMGLCLSVIISVVVYACYCIWNEGYFSMNENRKRVLIAFGLISLLNFAVFARQAIEDGIIEDGVLSVECINLACGVMFLIIFTVVLLKWNKDKREAE